MTRVLPAETHLSAGDGYTVLKMRIAHGDWRSERFMPEDQVWHWPVEWWNDADGVPAFLRTPGPRPERCEACAQRAGSLAQRLHSPEPELFGVALRDANRHCEDCDGRSSKEPPLDVIVSALHAIADRAEVESLGRVYVHGYARERHPDTYPQSAQQDLRWLTREQWRAFNDAIPQAGRVARMGESPDPAPVLAILDSGITTRQFALRLWRAGVSTRLAPERQRQLEEMLDPVPVLPPDSDVPVSMRTRRVFPRREPATLTCFSNVECDCVSYLAGVGNRVVSSNCPHCQGSGAVPLIEFAEHEPCDTSVCDYQTADVRPIRGGIGWIIGDEYRDGVAGGFLISSEYRERAEAPCTTTGAPACIRRWVPDAQGRCGLHELPDGTWAFYGAPEWQTGEQARAAVVPLGRLELETRRRRIHRAREKLKAATGSVAHLLWYWQRQPEALDRPTPAAQDWPERDVCWRRTR